MIAPVLGLTVAVPLSGPDRIVTVVGSRLPSTSESLSATSMVTGVSSGVAVGSLLAVGASLIAVTSVALVARPTPALRVSVLDIGQGDAILLESDDGTRLLVDGGPDPDLLVRRLDERIPAWDRHIDLALLTTGIKDTGVNIGAGHYGAFNLVESLLESWRHDGHR